MGEWLDAFPDASAIFDEAESAGFPARDICFHASAEELGRTEATQPALLTVAVATWQRLGALGIEPGAVAGHSLGEHAALVAAGVVTFAEALEIVRRRGALMAKAGEDVDCGMVAVIGLDASRIEDICQEIDPTTSSVVVANYNAPGQAVISGLRGSLDKASARCKDAGARRVVPLAVSGAFHSPMMAGAQERLSTVIEGANFRAPNIPFYPNVSAVAETEPARIRQLVTEQVTAPVRWEDTVRNMHAAGIVRFVEVGPGKVLTGLIRRILPEATTFSTHNAEALEEAIDALA